MKTVTVKFSIPENTNSLLHSLVEQRVINSFVTKAITKALEEQQNLKIAYAAANNDLDRKGTIEDWAVLDNDGWK